jgi:hypothetical protein
MKNLILVITIATTYSFCAFGQTGKDVPENVKTAFMQKFPKATKVKWGKENEKEWEAEFIMNGKDYSANFDNKGAWMETEYEINIAEIPVAVKATIDKEFPGYKIEKSEISETSEGKVGEFLLKKGEEKTEAAIDMNGKLLKKEQVKKEKEENEENEKDED